MRHRNDVQVNDFASVLYVLHVLVFQNDVAGKGPVTLDYNAIFGNMYRDFLANNTSSASGVEANTTTTTTATAESSKVFIPPECYAVSIYLQFCRQ